MFKLNKKGQASSTFSLLIAAVVALAILGVLLSILNVIPGMNTKPGDATKTLLSTQINRYGEEQCTTKVTFDTSNARLATQAATLDTGLSAEQVYFDNPEELSQFEITGTSETSNQMLRYKPTNSYKVLMCVVCSNNKDSLQSAIELNQKSSDVFASVDDMEGIEDDQTICVVYPRKTR